MDPSKMSDSEFIGRFEAIMSLAVGASERATLSEARRRLTAAAERVREVERERDKWMQDHHSSCVELQAARTEVERLRGKIMEAKGYVLGYENQAAIEALDAALSPAPAVTIEIDQDSIAGPAIHHTIKELREAVRVLGEEVTNLVGGLRGVLELAEKHKTGAVGRIVGHVGWVLTMHRIRFMFDKHPIAAAAVKEKP